MGGITRLWRTDNSEQIGKPIASSGSYFGVSLSDDGNVVAVVGETNRDVRLFRTEDGTPIGNPLHYESSFKQVVVSGDGHVAAVADSQGTVRLWDSDGGKPIRKPLRCAPFNPAMALSSDGKLLVARGFGTRNVQLWQTDDGTMVGKPWYPGSEIKALALCGDGKVLAFGDMGGTVRLWLIEEGHPTGKPLMLGTELEQLAVNSDGRVVAVGPGVARVWQTANQANDMRLDYGHPAPTVRYSGDGKLMAALWNRTSIRLTDTVTGEPVGEPLDYGNTIYAIALSEDGCCRGRWWGRGNSIAMEHQQWRADR